MKLFGYNIVIKRDEKQKEDIGKIRDMISPFHLYLKSIPHDDYYAQVMAYKSWVYICAKKNSEAVASVPLRLYVRKETKDQKFTTIRTREVSKETKFYLNKHAGLSHILVKGVDFEEVIEHPFIDLIQSVNPFNNRFDLWENTEMFLELTGNSYWYLVKNTKLGTPGQIWVIPSQFMRIVPGKEKFIVGYLYQNGSVKIPFDEEEIIHFKFASPISQYYGYSPIAAVDVAYSLNELTGEYEKALLENQGRPEGIIYPTEDMQPEDFERVKREFRERYSGAENVGKTMILQGGLKYQPLTMSPKDMVTASIRNMSREEIAAAYNIPMSKLTTEDVNRSNSEVGEVQYKRDAIVPRLKRIEEKLNEKLIPLYDKKLFVAFDNPVPEDKEFKLREREINLKNFYSSVNLERAKDGEKAVAWGEVPLGQMGIMPISTQNYPAPGSDTPPKPPQGPKPNSNEDVLVDMVESIAYRVKDRVERILDLWQKTLDKDDNKDE